MRVEQETAVLVAKYLVRRAKDNVFGILVRNLPLFDIPQLLNVFKEARQNSITFRLGLIGYDADLPTEHEVVGTTSIATVVDWRNTTVEPKIVIVRENAPLLHSLNQFEQLKGEKLYQLVADEAGRTTGLELLWRVLKRPRVRSFIPLEGLLAYYTALLNAGENQRRFEAGKSLYLLGLLEDRDLFQDLAPAKIAQRLEQNHDYVTKIARMNTPDRQRLSRALRLPNDLAETYERVMDYYRKPQETDLQGLMLENVKRLWQLPEEPLPSDPPSTIVEDIPDSGPLPSDGVSPIHELSPTRARETVEVLLDFDPAKRDELLHTHFDQLRERDQEVREDQNAGMLYQTQQLFERTLTERYWGGILRLRPSQTEDENEVSSLGDAIPNCV